LSTQVTGRYTDRPGRQRRSRLARQFILKYGSCAHGSQADIQTGRQAGEKHAGKAVHPEIVVHTGHRQIYRQARQAGGSMLARQFILK
jgi:hypothetical protein